VTATTVNRWAGVFAAKAPPESFFAVSAVFHYLGPAFAVLLFARVDVLGVAWLRIASAALIFAAWRRPWRAFRALDREGRRVLLAWGTVLALMNCIFYSAIDRLPLGTVAAIEFLPVIVLAAIGTRTARNLVALVMAFRNDTLRKTVLDQTGGSIENITAFSEVAEEFGQAQGKPGGLRHLKNDKTLDPEDLENLVDVAEPHELCQVLTGALYAVMVKIHDSLKKQYAKRDGTSEFSASGKALYVGAERFKRMVFRALDYLPPGEISFADKALLDEEFAQPPSRRPRARQGSVEIVGRDQARAKDELAER